MAWCPNCKNEFVEGIKICPKCDIELTNDKESIFASEKQKIESSLYNKSLIPEDYQSSFDEDAFSSALDKEFYPDINESINNNSEDSDADNAQSDNVLFDSEQFSFSSEDAGNTENEVMNLLKEMTEKSIKQNQQESAKQAVYVDKKVKVEETKSSAWSLLIVGIVGMICIILYFTGIFPFELYGFSKYTIIGVMGALFVILIVMGIKSFKDVKVYENEAEKEDKLTEEIRKWYAENLSSKIIDENLFFDNENDPEEMKYFIRFSKIKHLLNDKFMYLDEGYVDHISEEIYQWAFENEN